MSILKKIFAYAIMPIDKKDYKSIWMKEESPDRVAAQFGDSS
jgi:hypothetical protein